MVMSGIVGIINLDGAPLAFCRDERRFSDVYVSNSPSEILQQLAFLAINHPPLAISSKIAG
jgi:hypothetical protein